MSGENPFDMGAAAAAQYDAWYDSPVGRSVLRAEQRCVRELLAGAPRPWLEVGAGSGRFGGDLDADIGLDPAPALLRIAATRMRSVVRGAAEALPVRDATLGAVIAVTVLEFLGDVEQALRGIAAALRPNGRSVVGFMPRGGPWAAAYEREGRDAASVFHRARFLSVDEVVSLAARAGLRMTGVRAALFDPPGAPQSARVTETADAAAGFVALALAPAGAGGGKGR